MAWFEEAQDAAQTSDAGPGREPAGQGAGRDEGPEVVVPSQASGKGKVGADEQEAADLLAAAGHRWSWR